MDPEPTIRISALEHHEYCARQCALIHGDQVWADNKHTTGGTRAHRRVDSGVHRCERGRFVLRSIPLWSEYYGLAGRADAVEIEPDGSVSPVEYKSGTRHGRAADLQLCAQALCLEEMLTVQIPVGFLWFGGTRHRQSVPFDAVLRNATTVAIEEIRATLRADRLPAAPTDHRCDECQLQHHCLPGIVALDQPRLCTSVERELFRCDS